MHCVARSIDYLRNVPKSKFYERVADPSIIKAEEARAKAREKNLLRARQRQHGSLANVASFFRKTRAQSIVNKLNQEQGHAAEGDSSMFPGDTSTTFVPQVCTTLRYCMAVLYGSVGVIYTQWGNTALFPGDTSTTCVPQVYNRGFRACACACACACAWGCIIRLRMRVGCSSVVWRVAPASTLCMLQCHSLLRGSSPACTS